MNMKMSSAVRSLVIAMALVVFGLNVPISPVSAQNAPDPKLQAAEVKLEELLDKLELSYQRKKLPDGQKQFVFLWESAGEASKIFVNITQVGTSNTEPVFGFTAFSVVASLPEGQSLPAAVIKLVTATNDSRRIGYYSTSAQHNIAYSNCTGVLDELSSRALAYNFLYLHENRIALKKEVDRILAADK